MRRWSAALMVAIGGLYAAVLSAGFARHGLKEPIADPILAVMEVLTLASAPTLVALMAAIHDRASAAHKIHGLIALAFTVAFATLTSAVHFVELTAVRQTGASRIVWPSAAYAVELLAWDVFLGLALLFAAPVFEGERRVRCGLLLAGALCLAGTAGPAVGNMRLQLMGVLGYAGVLPVVSFMLARLPPGPPASAAPRGGGSA